MSKVKSSSFCLVVLVCSLALPASAQYMYLDANGDGVNSAADSLNASGPTLLTIYLNTNHDRDGTLRSCNGHTGAPSAGGPINLFGYTIVLKAVGGTVTWGAFTPLDPAYTPLGADLADSTDTQFTRMRPAQTFTAAGPLQLGTISVTSSSGTPGVVIGTSTGLDPFGFGTDFATQCDGSAYPNSYVLGTDWFDIDGIRGTGDSSGMTAPAESFSAGSGTLYLGGNRIQAPYAVTFYGGDLVINGLRIAGVRANAPSLPSATAEDSLEHRLISSVSLGAVALRRQGLSELEILTLMRNQMLASPSVQSADIVRDGLAVQFRSGHRVRLMPPKSDQLYPSLRVPSETAVRSAWLYEVRWALSTGHIVFILGPFDVQYLRPKMLDQISKLVARLQAGDVLEPSESSVLAPAVQYQLRHPLQLERAQ